MNFSLAREIYGLTPWFVDSHSLPGLLGVLDNVSTLEPPTIKYNTPQVLDLANNTRVITDEYELRRADEDFAGIGIININGPITKNGGQSSLGMVEIAEQALRMNRDSRIKAFLVLGDSGGGASNAVEIMVDTINEIKETKTVWGLIPKGGMAASACYGIMSACTKIFSESEMNIVGSAGTMIEFMGKKANTEDAQGFKHIRLYATKSTEKNKGFEEALNNDNYTVLIDELLDPVNESFLTLIETNRPVLKGTDFNNGNTKFSKNAIGTFIDGIMSFDEVIESLLVASKLTRKTNNNNLNSKVMTREELRSAHPKLYNTVFNLGVTSEVDRVGAWMAHLAADPKSVVAGIESNKAITTSDTQKFIVKMASKTQLDGLKLDSAGNVITEEGKTEKKDPTEIDNFYAGIDAKLNLKPEND